jgi:hypothetical protein
VVGVEGGCSAGSGPVLQEGAEVLCGMDGLPVPEPAEAGDGG